MIAADSARPTLSAWLLCAVLIAGCVTHGPLATLQPVAAPDSAARIVVVREARIVVQPVWQVVLDGRPVYGLAGGEHIARESRGPNPRD
jgi:hypothetical protein